MIPPKDPHQTAMPSAEDGPPVFLPEPARPQETAIPPAPPRETDTTQPGRGIRIDTPDPALRSHGIPSWMIFAGLVGTLALSISTDSPMPFIVGVIFFILLRRRERR